MADKAQPLTRPKAPSSPSAPRQMSDAEAATGCLAILGGIVGTALCAVVVPAALIVLMIVAAVIYLRRDAARNR